MPAHSSNTGSFLDRVVQFAKVVTSSVSGETGAVLYNVAGIGGFTDDADDDAGEMDEAVPTFGGFGLVGRPLPPGTIGTRPVNAEVVCVRTADGLVPIAHRDLRLRLPGGAPFAGDVALVGYGGGFHSLAPVDDGDAGTIHIIYCPYDFATPGDPSTAQKAHVITIDPTVGNESISIVHADGMHVDLFDGKVVAASPNGENFVSVNDDAVTLSGNVKVVGGFDAGPPGTVGFPLAKSSELIAWAALVNTALSGLGAAIAPLSPTVTTVTTNAT